MAPPRRGFLKKLSLISAVFSFASALLALGLAIWSWMIYGKQHVYTGSLGATSFFFFSAAIVLYEMSRPQPPLPPPDDQA